MYEFISPYGERAKKENTCVDNFRFLKYCDYYRFFCLFAGLASLGFFFLVNAFLACASLLIIDCSKSLSL
jgi:hypothetical protein